MPDDEKPPETRLSDQLGTSFRAQIPPAPAPFGLPPGAVQVTTTVQASGPLPLPSLFTGYGEIDPSFPNRIMVMAEQNAATERRTAERAQIFALIEGLAGRSLGAAFAITAILVAARLAVTGHDWVAGVIGGATVVAIAGALIAGRLGEQNT